MKASILLLCAFAAPVASAADWEVAVHGGTTFPFYEQSFEFDPGSVAIPGTTVTEEGVFRLDGKGGLALGASLSVQGRVLGLEARLDTADVRVETIGARYEISTRLPPPLPNVTTTVDLGGGDLDLERLRPVSLNLRFRSPGRTSFVASGGISYLPAFRFVVRQGVSIRLPFLASGTDVAHITLPAEALPGDDSEGRLGWNAGAGLHYAFGPRLALVVEGRYFRFQRQTLEWGEPESSIPLPQFQAEIVRQVAERLDPVRFNPTFFQASAGLALRF
jgi:opacity protein-like surface antigen